LEKAIGYYEQALQIDPKYARAWAGPRPVRYERRSAAAQPAARPALARLPDENETAGPLIATRKQPDFSYRRGTARHSRNDKETE